MLASIFLEDADICYFIFVTFNYAKDHLSKSYPTESIWGAYMRMRTQWFVKTSGAINTKRILLLAIPIQTIRASVSTIEPNPKVKLLYVVYNGSLIGYPLNGNTLNLTLWRNYLINNWYLFALIVDFSSHNLIPKDSFLELLVLLPQSLEDIRIRFLLLDSFFDPLFGILEFLFEVLEHYKVILWVFEVFREGRVMKSSSIVDV